MKYDLSDFDNLSEENEFFGLPYDKNTDSLIKQYFQTKIEEAEKRGYVKGVSDHSKRVEDLIDQEVKKTLEEIKTKIAFTIKDDIELMEITNLINSYLK